jgi:hypothetical protein
MSTHMAMVVRFELWETSAAILIIRRMVRDNHTYLDSEQAKY